MANLAVALLSALWWASVLSTGAWFGLTRVDALIWRRALNDETPRCSSWARQELAGSHRGGWGVVLQGPDVCTILMALIMAGCDLRIGENEISSSPSVTSTW